MLGKIKNVLVGIFCFSLVSAAWLSAPMSIEEGGANINRFLAFGLWVLSVFLIVKGKAIIATIGSTVIVVAMMIHNGGVKANFSNIDWYPLWEFIAAVIVLFFVGKIIVGLFEGYQQNLNEIAERRENAKKNGQVCCPHCASVSIQYYPLGIPHKEYDANLEREVIMRDGYPIYHCNKCGKEWS